MCDGSSSIFPPLIKRAGLAAARALHARVLKSGHSCDVWVRNSLLGNYARHGPLESAEALFHETRERRLVEDSNSMLSAYWRWGRAHEARRLFDVMRERKNVVTWTAMVSGLAKAGDVEAARTHFDAMPVRNTTSWNAMISGYVLNGRPEEALTIFGAMTAAPDEATCVAVAASCAALGDARAAGPVLAAVREGRVRLNCVLKTALVNMHAKCGELEAARLVFDGAGDRNVVMWNAMINGYVWNGDTREARALFDRLGGDGDTVTWNTMIAGYARNGRPAEAIELFKMMAGKARPDAITMASVLSATAHLGSLELGGWVADCIAENRIELGVSGLNSMVFMYASCGSVRDAERVFRGMLSRDVVSYNAFIGGLAAHGRASVVLRLLDEMGARGVGPDRITYMGVLTACAHAGMVKEGKRVFEEIEAPTVDHYACMVDLLGRAGRLDEAVGMVLGMPMKAHAGVYGALLNASRVHKRVDVGEYAARELFELEPGEPGNYLVLAGLYAGVNRRGDADRLMKTMEEKGMYKAVAGESWLEVGRELRRFVAGERGRDWAEEVYGVSEGLRMISKTREGGFGGERSNMKSVKSSRSPDQYFVDKLL
ncbi:Pentatricopeptide repeat-containing protein [Acorus gramineus]|uniref:Pentatricopeptide repeat-containing protein n=1 Tax=Acorus gramineus TaxID=55184 RepID=A0AAV9BI54_ACOGR|nr:Pentatricopeptide repeat-containing protein [Acorus gramineus]